MELLTMTRIIRVYAVVLFLLVGMAESQAASPVTYTTIHVHDMHCGECAKKIARKLYAIPGVVEVRADVGKNVAFVVPQKDKTLSARSLWDAVESAGFNVARLEGPQGTFVAKPSR
jgi:copper chaperone CopZ